MRLLLQSFYYEGKKGGSHSNLELQNFPSLFSYLHFAMGEERDGEKRNQFSLSFGCLFPLLKKLLSIWMFFFLHGMLVVTVAEIKWGAGFCLCFCKKALKEYISNVCSAIVGTILYIPHQAWSCTSSSLCCPIWLMWLLWLNFSCLSFQFQFLYSVSEREDFPLIADMLNLFLIVLWEKNSFLIILHAWELWHDNNLSATKLFLKSDD